VFAKKLMYDLNVAKEIVQDFFVSLYKKPSSLTISSSLKDYFNKFIYSRCMNHHKQIKTRTEHYECSGQESNDHIGFQDTIAEMELEYHIFQAIVDLSPQCQKIFSMSRIEGSTNQQIGDQLNISNGRWNHISARR
jgi:RNA polymerase sigma-70 factor, ECF subfamily